MLKIFLPIFFPSWRFFSSIGPSPRIDVTFVAEETPVSCEWIPFQPIPSTLTVLQHAFSLFHNPQRSEKLFINTCAERFFEEQDEYYLEEIASRILHTISTKQLFVPDTAQFMQFRIRAIYSADAPANELGKVIDEIVVLSPVYRLSRPGVGL